MISSRLIVAALVGWLLVGWLSAAPQVGSGPSPRFTMSMAFDSHRNVSVMFGGYGANGFLGDTWEWDGSAWHERTPTNSPTPREASMMAFDTSRGVCVLFGGVDSSGNHPGDTWEWDGQDWSLVATSGAGGRRNGDMVFDAVKGVCVMHGGYDGSWQNDTWEWDGALWSNVSSPNGMSARNAHRMAFDRSRGVTVLYGGNLNGYNDETWEWGGATWSLINPTSPPGNRAIHSMCYDVARQRVFMFGGRPGFNSESDEAWEWDGTDWTLIQSSRSPVARYGASCVYDESRDEVVLFGGRSGSGFLGDTWVFDGLEWLPKLDYVTSPVNGNRYALTPPMTWQEAEDLAVLEGGHLATVRSQAEDDWLVQSFGAPDVSWIGLNDFAIEGQFEWVSGEPLGFENWNPNEPSGGTQENGVVLYASGTPAGWHDGDHTQLWTGIIELPGGPVGDVATASANTVAPSAFRSIQSASLPAGGALSFGGETAAGLWAFTYEWAGGVWSKQVSVLNPMPRTGHSLILDEGSQANLLFGGENFNAAKLSETWTYQGGQWTYLAPANAPSARSEHAMAYDPSSSVGVLFGGEDASGTALNDMWAWDGIDWSQTTSSTLPPARSGHGLAYDRYRSRLVLFGGTDGTARLNDIWEWDGTDWTQITPAQPNGVAYGPSVRDGFVMAYDPRSERVVVIGGETDSGCVDEVWSWDGAGWLRHLPSNGSTLPSARKDAAIFVDAVTNELRMFGGGCGSEFSDELWELQLPVFARSEVIGVGCAGSNGVPALSVANGTAPVLGAQLDFVYDNALNAIFVTPAVVAVGFDQGIYQGIPLPLPLAVIGLPGCTLYHSNELSFSVGVAPGAAQFTWPLTIPNDTTLLGKDVFVQGLHLEFPGSASWAAMSNAVGLRIGDQ